MHTYEQLFSWQQIPIAQGLISQRDISDRLGYVNIRNALMELARRRVVPIINENDVVAIEELSGEVFGDNDRLSALVANLVDADLLIHSGQRWRALYRRPEYRSGGAADSCGGGGLRKRK